MVLAGSVLDDAKLVADWRALFGGNVSKVELLDDGDPTRVRLAYFDAPVSEVRIERRMLLAFLRGERWRRNGTLRKGRM